MSKAYLKMQKRVCGVCGDIAIGRNFGAITCESCKAFFRRAAFRNEALICNTNGKCVINIQNRKTCKKCRLNKCLAIGMIKELILKNNEKGCNGLKQSKRSRVQSFSGSVDSNNSSSVDSTFSDTDFDLILENCCLSDEELSAEIEKFEEFINSPSISIDSENELSLMPIMKPIATFNKSLNEIEIKRLDELSLATKCLNTLLKPFAPNIIVFSNLKDIYTNVMTYTSFDEHLEDYIQFCKNLADFKEICQDDQLALAKKGYFETFSWLYFPHYNYEDESWTFSLNDNYSMKFDLSLIKKESEELYNICKNFMLKVGTDWIRDNTIRNLLSVVAIFNPNRPNLNHKELIKLKQEMYIYLLQRYLRQKYPNECESMEKCSTILRSVAELKCVAEVSIEFEKRYIEIVSPLFREFLE